MVSGGKNGQLEGTVPICLRRAPRVSVCSTTSVSGCPNRSSPVARPPSPVAARLQRLQILNEIALLFGGQTELEVAVVVLDDVVQRHETTVW